MDSAHSSRPSSSVRISPALRHDRSFLDAASDITHQTGLTSPSTTRPSRKTTHEPAAVSLEEVPETEEFASSKSDGMKTQRDRMGSEGSAVPSWTSSVVREHLDEMLHGSEHLPAQPEPAQQESEISITVPKPPAVLDASFSDTTSRNAPWGDIERLTAALEYPSQSGVESEYADESSWQTTIDTTQRNGSGEGPLSSTPKHGERAGLGLGLGVEDTPFREASRVTPGTNSTVKQQRNAGARFGSDVVSPLQRRPRSSGETSRADATLGAGEIGYLMEDDVSQAVVNESEELWERNVVEDEERVVGSGRDEEVEQMKEVMDKLSKECDRRGAIIDDLVANLTTLTQQPRPTQPSPEQEAELCAAKDEIRELRGMMREMLQAEKMKEEKRDEEERIRVLREEELTRERAREMDKMRQEGLQLRKVSGGIRSVRSAKEGRSPVVEQQQEQVQTEDERDATESLREKMRRWNELLSTPLPLGRENGANLARTPKSVTPKSTAAKSHLQRIENIPLQQRRAPSDRKAPSSILPQDTFDRRDSEEKDIWLETYKRQLAEHEVGRQAAENRMAELQELLRRAETDIKELRTVNAAAQAATVAAEGRVQEARAEAARTSFVADARAASAVGCGPAHDHHTRPLTPAAMPDATEPGLSREDKIYYRLQLYKLDRLCSNETGNILKNILIQLDTPLDDLPTSIQRLRSKLVEGKRLRRFAEDVHEMVYEGERMAAGSIEKRCLGEMVARVGRLVKVAEKERERRRVGSGRY
ncbi:hypothetical protein YB2330_001027 [Saitoella coloradoensis]